MLPHCCPTATLPISCLPHELTVPSPSAMLPHCRPLRTWGMRARWSVMHCSFTSKLPHCCPAPRPPGGGAHLGAWGTITTNPGCPTVALAAGWRRARWAGGRAVPSRLLRQRPLPAAPSPSPGQLHVPLQCRWGAAGQAGCCSASGRCGGDCLRGVRGSAAGAICTLQQRWGGRLRGLTE